jgi:hypothetical protein
MWDNKATELFELPVAHSQTGAMMLLATVTEGITQEHLQQVYSDSYITKVGHDGRPAAPVEHPLVTYLTARVGDQFMGAFMAIRFSSTEMELHALLHRKAVSHSRELGRAFLSWAFSHPILRVTAYIIEGLETAKNYCLKLGMKLEGFRREACLQNGQVKGVYILGMTRADWSKS